MPPKNALATCCKENVAEESCRDVQQKSPYRDVLQNSWRNLCKDVRVDCLYRRVGEECQISRCWREALEKFQSSSRSRSMVLCYHHVKRRINPLIIGVQKSCTLQIKSTGFSSSIESFQKRYVRTYQTLQTYNHRVPMFPANRRPLKKHKKKKGVFSLQPSCVETRVAGFIFLVPASPLTDFASSIGPLEAINHV